MIHDKLKVGQRVMLCDYGMYGRIGTLSTSTVKKVNKRSYSLENGKTITLNGKEFGSSGIYTSSKYWEVYDGNKYMEIHEKIKNKKIDDYIEQMKRAGLVDVELIKEAIKKLELKEVYNEV